MTVILFFMVGQRVVERTYSAGKRRVESAPTRFEAPIRMLLKFNRFSLDPGG
jgi:hypothetical protein